MYKIFIQEDSQAMELNINGNLTINNLIANLQSDGHETKYIIYNNKMLRGGGKIKDILKNGDTVKV